jgi:RimJ/RimL family protein N-acetyltransferase
VSGFDPMGLLRRARDISADLGWRRTLGLAPRWLVRRRYLALEAWLEAAHVEEHPAELRATPLGDADWPALAELDPTMTREEVARRRGEGQECVLGWWNDELVHHRWTSTMPVYLPYLGRVLRPLPGDQIVVGVYTSPRYRGHHVTSVVMHEDMRRAHARGLRRLVWLAAWWNARSLKIAEQVASRVVGTVEYWAVGRLRRYAATGGVRIERDGAVVIGRSTADTPPRI